MIEALNRMMAEAYADARAHLAAEGRRVEGLSARLDEDHSFMAGGARLVLSFDTTPITGPRDALQTSMTRRAR